MFARRAAGPSLILAMRHRAFVHPMAVDVRPRLNPGARATWRRRPGVNSRYRRRAKVASGAHTGRTDFSKAAAQTLQKFYGSGALSDICLHPPIEFILGLRITHVARSPATSGQAHPRSCGAVRNMWALSAAKCLMDLAPWTAGTSRPESTASQHENKTPYIPINVRINV